MVDIEGPEKLALQANSITMEAAATSVQLHLQVSPEGFGRTWNAAQAASAAQVAVGCNSPFFLGKELWRETRIALFEQTIDTRTEELTAQGVRPRVWFGERWIDSITDLFDENVTYFPALLPLLDDEDPDDDAGARATSRTCASSRSTTARSTAGTAPSTTSPAASPTCGWRTGCCRPDRRSSTPSPTPPSTTAWSARWPRTTTRSSDSCRSRRRRTTSARRRGTASTRCCSGPGVGVVPASELVLRTLLPLAHRGLDAWQVDRRDRDHYLGIIEQRCLTRMTGAAWQVEDVPARCSTGATSTAARR